jgi:hypothetical protein
MNKTGSAKPITPFLSAGTGGELRPSLGMIHKDRGTNLAWLTMPLAVMVVVRLHGDRTSGEYSSLSFLSSSWSLPLALSAFTNS